VSERLRTLGVLTVVLADGVMLGSAVSQCGQTVGPQDPIEAEYPPPPGTRDRIRVEVLNSGGRSGMALQATDFLRDRGIDVVSWGNAAEFSETSSEVVDRVGDEALAAWLSETLGINSVSAELDPTRLVEATVRLGPEWSIPTTTPVEAPVAVRWWDLRRYFR
jgi:hypothetical protein